MLEKIKAFGWCLAGSIAVLGLVMMVLGTIWVYRYCAYTGTPLF